MKVLDIITESSTPQIYSIGDSHAVAVATAGKFINLATNGRSTMDSANSAAIDQVTPGSTVVLSAGANDMLNPNKQQVVNHINGLIGKLEQKKCKVFYILFAETDSPKYAKDRNQLRQLVKTSLPSGVEVIDMGKLSVSSGDGIHAPMSWYAASAKQVKAGASSSPAKVSQAPQVATDKTAEAAGAKGSLQVPSSLWHGEDTRAIQQALIDLGYQLPKHGADSYFGPETANVVRKFQKEHGLKVDGQPGPETVGKLNSLAGKKSDTTVPPATRSMQSPDAKKDIPKQGAMVTPGPAKSKGGRNIVDKGDISAYLKSKRMSGNHRIGILANIAGESSFNSAVINPNDKGKRSIGLFQHRAERADSLEAAVPDWQTNWKGQIDFALDEPAGKRYLATKFKTYEQAVEQWVRDFERPADAWGATTARIKVADDLVNNKV